MDDDTLLAAFEDTSLPFDEWNHRAHVRVAVLYVRRHGLHTALEKMRSGVQTYNTAHKVENKVDQGYHETITCAFLRLIAAPLNNASRRLLPRTSASNTRNCWTSGCWCDTTRVSES